MTSPLERAWSALRSRRPARAAVAGIALGAALPAAMLLAAGVTLMLSGDRAASSETLFLALWAAAVFAPLSWLESSTRPVHVALGLATTAAVLTLPRTGGLRPATVACLLALSVLCLASLALARRPAPTLRTACALVLAAAICLHGHFVFLEGFSLRSVVLLAVLPAIAAVAGTGLAAGGRPGAGLATVFALLAGRELATEPWWVVLACATAASIASLGSGAAARLARHALALFAAATLFAGSFPWLRAAPIASLAGALATVVRPVVDTPVSERAVVLTQASPVLEVDLSGAPVSALVVDSYLTNSVDLACGRELAALDLEEELGGTQARTLAKGSWHATLVVGHDSAEWAAGRPDVAARLACPAPPAWIFWIPGAGRFLGQTTRARFEIPLPRAGQRLRIARSPALPPETALAIFFVATRR
ncbi:MAG: hypothetical protein ABIV06_12570 [Thermoanaerobaculia bacterium]